MSIDGIDVSGDIYQDGKAYWKKISADINGMLGGFSNLNFEDVKESKRILRKLIDEMRQANENINTLRTLDCGAGIGRVTKYVLTKFFDEIDLLEQNDAFLAASKEYIGKDSVKVKNLIPQGIQQFTPLDGVRYDCIWGQWVFGHIIDKDLIEFLNKCYQVLNKPHGIIVIKENVTKTNESIFDEIDSSVTRTEDAFMRIFAHLDRLEWKYTFKQKMPKEMFPVRIFVLSCK